ncbi:hypothetical protein CCAX7_007760 [Capsulimonas corticalis]|uniref:Uncharacterized protein n=1 Tax=Capsulimonas corticalis TaxID=2219043 RepID=A0A402D1R4_9BACT|nr:polysaccharide pyruvyl transferase family protein [Capsulimonas corticalis]BDI28725.1 hypothetical protein CCAX7_007760 [Capsulimonas corticalis]
MKKNVRVLITDNVISNMGDAAILLAMKSSFEEAFGPGTDVRNCYCGVTREAGPFAKFYPELHFTSTLWNAGRDWTIAKWDIWGRLIRKTATERFPLQARLRRMGFPLFLLTSHERELFREFEEADIISVAGGACLSTSWTVPFMRKSRVAQYQVAHALGKPLFVYAHSLGPFRDGDNFPDLLHDSLDHAAAVLCRDAEAVKAAREQIKLLGDNVHQTIDEALRIIPRPPSKLLAPEKKKPLRVGICVHDYIWPGAADRPAKQADFEARIARVCQSLLERGDTELVFLTSHQKVEGSFQDDEPVGRRIQELLPAPLRPDAHHVTGFVHPREFSYFMGHCDLVLSSRLHGGILSLVGGAPVVVLEYEPKSRGLMRQIGLEDWVLTMADATSDEITAKITELLSDLPKTRERARAGLAEGQKLAKRNIEIVVEAAQAHWAKSERGVLPSRVSQAESKP